MTASAERIDPARTALIAYDVCKRILTPADTAARERMRPHLESWAVLINLCRELNIPIIYTTPVSRADGADVVMLPTDLSAETGTPPLTNCVEGSDDASFPDLIAQRPEDYVFLKRRPSAFYGTGVAELLHMLRRDAIVIGGGGSNRGVETSVREAFSMDIMAVVVREVCYGGNQASHDWAMNVSMKMFGRIRTLEQTLAMLRG